VEAAAKRAVEYIETNIVPKARRDGEKVLRRLSEELSRWAVPPIRRGAKQVSLNI
jgi:hypothetical protein